MKILHVIANLAPRYGGPAKAGFEMSSALVRRGHEVCIFTTNQDGSNDLDVPLDQPVIKEGVKIRYFQVQSPRFWRTSFSLAKALKTEMRNYDIVHIHSIYLFHGLVAGYYARKYNIPYIIRPHGTLDPVIYQRHRLRKKIMEILFENKNIREASSLHYTTEEEMELAKPYTFDAPGFIVPNGLNISEYEKLPSHGAFREKHPQLIGKIMMLFLSRISFKKGLDVLIAAFKLINERYPDAYLVLTGPDDEGYYRKVKEWIDEAGLTNQVIYTGMLTGEEKLSVLRDADLFVLPSYSENFGISVIESLACGTPVVVSDKVNIWREVVANEAGAVSRCDSDEFAQKVIELLENPELLKRYGINGQRLVKDSFAWEGIAGSLEEKYLDIIKKQSADSWSVAVSKS